jgi:hypothetical protein
MIKINERSHVGHQSVSSVCLLCRNSNKKVNTNFFKWAFELKYGWQEVLASTQVDSVRLQTSGHDLLNIVSMICHGVN